MPNMSVEELLKSRKKLKSIDEGINPPFPSKKSRMLNGYEIPTEGVEMPRGEGKRKINIEGKDYEVPTRFAPKTEEEATLMKKGGSVKAKSKPKTSTASKRGDGIAQRGKTKGRFV